MSKICRKQFDQKQIETLRVSHFKIRSGIKPEKYVSKRKVFELKSKKNTFKNKPKLKF
jgi:hypothetical protein